MTISKTIYPASGKIVLDNEITGIMIDDEQYEDMILVGMSDEDIFERIRVD